MNCRATVPVAILGNGGLSTRLGTQLSVANKDAPTIFEGLANGLVARIGDPGAGITDAGYRGFPN